MLKKTIIIGEHHEDPGARLFVRLNIQFFISKGFSVFGFEHGDRTDLQTEIQWLQEDLDFANCCMGMAMYVFLIGNIKKCRVIASCLLKQANQVT